MKTMFDIPYVPKDEVISLLEDKQRDLCPTGRFGRGYVYGSDREEFDRWQELIDAVERNRIEKHWWYFSESIGPEFSKEQFVFDEEWFDKIDESVDVGDIGGLL